MSEVRPLFIWALPEHAPSVESLRAAKAGLELDFLVKIVAADKGNFGERVLAVGTIPPWGVDYFLVAETCSEAELRAGIAWTLGDFEDWRATTMVDTLQSVLGAGVREIPPEELESERKLAAFVNGED